MPLMALALGLSVGTLQAQATNVAALQSATEQFSQFNRLHTVIAAHQGAIYYEETFGGPGPVAPVNIKSLSKTILSGIVGRAIEDGVLTGVDQSAQDALDSQVPANANARVSDITIGNLLSMQAGLERTSGGNYGRWVVSDNWVQFALSRPMIDEPGGRMLYSTGSTHLLSAALTEQSGRSTHDLAVDYLGRPLNVNIPPWPTDPQGIYFGGNDMVMSPRALLRFGEMYRLGGEIDGQRVLPESWIEASWEPRGQSPWTSDSYGYGWFITEMAGESAYYGRGFGGQVLYVIPALEVTVVVTSSPNPPSTGSRYLGQLKAVIEEQLLPAIEG